MKRTAPKRSSAIILTGIIFLLEIALIILGVVYFSLTLGIAVLAVTYSLEVIIGIVVVNCRSNANYKISWLIFIIIMPFLGLFCFLLFANKKFTKRELRQIKPVIEASKSALDSRFGKDDIDKLDKVKDADAINIATYIRNYSNNGIYTATKTSYYSWGESGFPVMLEKLKKAKHYIFIEYFIITEGEMWNAILEILIEKAKEGLDIRMIYDDFGCYKYLPKKYDKYLRSLGIKAYPFNKIKPLVEFRMNNRDHRKIMVIDGYIGFTGGINIADEYINRIERFGKWKDNLILLEGEAVFGLTSLFLANWVIVDKSKDPKTVNYLEYLPVRHQHEYINTIVNDGYVQPYGSVPFTYETIGQNVYINLISRAKKYIYITTPYLVLDDSLTNALCLAAKSGIKVKIITPYIPDKKVVHEITRSYYKVLMADGVEIYEYKPGFIHEKTIIIDGTMATVGTINFDYRSLFLHMENGTFLYQCSCINDMERDFVDTLKDCLPYSYEIVSNVGLFKKMWRAILRIIAPLV